VRHGEDVILPNGKHTFVNVYREMFVQVMLDYASLGNFRDLTYDEVEFFYEALRPSLRKMTKPDRG
jgi:hypothetical protein